MATPNERKKITEMCLYCIHEPLRVQCSALGQSHLIINASFKERVQMGQGQTLPLGKEGNC